MFNATATLPVFVVKDSGGNELDRKGIIPNTGKVTIIGRNFIVYTTNGTNPSVKNGEVVNGDAVAASTLNEMFDKDISLSGLAAGKVTIKAICVNGQGVASKIATLTITTIEPTGAGDQYGGMSPVTGPHKLIAGKTGKYAAKVTASAPAGTSKTIEWSLDGGVPATTATIDKKTGVLSIKKGAGGTITVRASAKGAPGVYSTLDVEISSPVAAIELGFPGGKDTLFVNGDGGAYLSTCALVQKVTLTDATEYSSVGDVEEFVSWSSNKPKIATVDTFGNVKAVGSGKAVITAKATDGSGKSAKVTVNCVVRTESVSITNKASLKRIALGCSITLKAVTTPAKPTKGGVTWELVSGPEGAKISSAGKLTAPKTVADGTPIIVKATAKDGYGASASTGTITVEQKSVEVKIHTNDPGGRETYNSKSSVSAINLFTVNPLNVTAYDRKSGGAGATKDSIDERTIMLWGDVDATTTGVDWVVWSSNKPAVATVDVDASGRCYIKAKGVGKATITCLALDGSGKKATCTVNVGIPASSLWVQGKRSLTTFKTPSLAFGKTLQMVAKPGAAYGKVTNTKVDWVCEVYQKENDGTFTLADPSIDGKVTISSSGKLTVKSGIRDDWTFNIGDDELTVFVMAVAKDGSGTVGMQYVDLCPGTDKMVLDYDQFWSGGRYYKDYVFWMPTGPDHWKAYYWLELLDGYSTSGGKLTWYGNYYSDYIITTSNPKVVAIEGYEYNSGVEMIFLRPLKTGSSTIKIVSNDGTGKSVSIKVTVNKYGEIMAIK